MIELLPLFSLTICFLYPLLTLKCVLHFGDSKTHGKLFGYICDVHVRVFLLDKSFRCYSLKFKFASGIDRESSNFLFEICMCVHKCMHNLQKENFVWYSVGEEEREGKIHLCILSLPLSPWNCLYKWLHVKKEKSESVQQSRVEVAAHVCVFSRFSLIPVPLICPHQLLIVVKMKFTSRHPRDTQRVQKVFSLQTWGG